MISRASERLGPDVRLYDMVVPTSMDILLPESFRAGLNTSSQKDAIAYLYGSMPAAVRTVPYMTRSRRTRTNMSTSARTTIGRRSAHITPTANTPRRRVSPRWSSTRSR